VLEAADAVFAARRRVRRRLRLEPGGWADERPAKRTPARASSCAVRTARLATCFGRNGPSGVYCGLDVARASVGERGHAEQVAMRVVHRDRLALRIGLTDDEPKVQDTVRLSGPCRGNPEARETGSGPSSRATARPGVDGMVRPSSVRHGAPGRARSTGTVP